MALSNIFNAVREAAGSGGYAAPAPTPYTAPAPAPAYQASTGGLPQQTAAPTPAANPMNLASLMGSDWESKFGPASWMTGNTAPPQFSYGGKNFAVEQLGQDQSGSNLGYIAYDPNDRYGSGAYYFDNSGGFSNHQAWREASNNMMVPLLAAGGMMLGLPGVGGFGGEAAAGLGELGMFEGTGLTTAFDGAAGAGLGGLSGMDMAADASSGFMSGTGYIPGAAGGIAPTVPLENVGAISSGAVAPVTAEGAAAGGLGSVGATAAAGAGGITGNPLIDKIITGVGTGAVTSAIGGALGGGGQQGGGGLGGLGGLLGGLIDYNKQNEMADKIFGYVNKANEDIDKLYQPGTPEAKYLWDQMSAKDAAAGRNSQYGVRTQEYAGKVAGAKADQKVRLAQGLSALFGTGTQAQAGAATGLSTGLGALLGGGSNGNGALGSVINNLSSYLNSNNSSTGYDNWVNNLGHGSYTNGVFNGPDQIYG
jgi:hypothetical protein